MSWSIDRFSQKGACRQIASCSILQVCPAESRGFFKPVNLPRDCSPIDLRGKIWPFEVAGVILFELNKIF